MTTPLTTAAEFIRFFEGIPDERWTNGMGDTHSGEPPTCAFGHLMRVERMMPVWDRMLDLSTPWRRLARILGLHPEAASSDAACIGRINDGKDPRYQQPTPKARILAALRDKL